MNNHIADGCRAGGSTRQIDRKKRCRHLDRVEGIKAVGGLNKCPDIEHNRVIGAVRKQVSRPSIRAADVEAADRFHRSRFTCGEKRKLQLRDALVGARINDAAIAAIKINIIAGT